MKKSLLLSPLLALGALPALAQNKELNLICSAQAEQIRLS